MNPGFNVASRAPRARLAEPAARLQNAAAEKPLIDNGLAR
jgi:hypothetical protein